MELRNMKNAIGYIRVSTTEQGEEDKYGIPAQKASILEYADREGYIIRDWKIDMASGVTEERPELDEILYGDIGNPPVEAVIVFKNDRLARDTQLYFFYTYTLKKKNIKLISVKEEFAEGGDYANILRSLILFVAEQERKNIALRTSKGRSIKAACGGYSGGRCPYGYKVENGRLVINEAERPMVEYIFKRLDEKTPVLTIATELGKMGYVTRKGTQIMNSTVRSIAENRPLYEGMYRYGPGAPWIKGVHEPILKGDKPKITKTE